MSMSYQNADDKLQADLADPATPFVLLHIGSPGENGTANVAQVTDGDPADIGAKAVVFGDAPANHATNTERFVKNTAAVTWSGEEIDASQEITCMSIWSAASAGDLLYVAAVGTPKTTGSDGVTIPVGDLEVAIGVFVKPA
jgi:hypothetical protein